MAAADGDGSKKQQPAIIKLAVQWENKQPVLYDFDQVRNSNCLCPVEWRSLQSFPLGSGVHTAFLIHVLFA